MKRIPITAIGFILLLIAFLFGLFVGKASPSSQSPLPSDSASVATSVKEATSAKGGQSPVSTHSPTPTPRHAATPTPRPGFYLVTRVLDGDTIELKGGKRIRYMGIDAPELYERWGTLAYETNRDLVEGKFVRVEEDHPDRDFYGRTLAHVFIDNVFVSEHLVDDGLAKVLLIKGEAKPKYLFLLEAAQARAQGATRGLWTPRP